jgi:hypothetical protein
MMMRMMCFLAPGVALSVFPSCVQLALHDLRASHPSARVVHLSESPTQPLAMPCESVSSRGMMCHPLLVA